MTVKQWLDIRVGKKIDDDGSYGAQCMDLYADYQRYCLQVTVKGAPAAKDVWNSFDSSVFTKIVNTPSFIPIRGDVAIWGTGVGQYGHIAICEGESNVNWFVSLDQNWFSPWNGTGPATYVRHSYDGFLGVLRPKKDVNFDQVAYDQQQALLAKAAKDAADALAKANAEAAAKEQARLAAEQAKLAEANRVAAETAKKLADDAAKAEAARIAAEQKQLAEEQVRLAKELADKLAADKALQDAEQARLDKEKADAEKANSESPGKNEVALWTSLWNAFKMFIKKLIKKG